MKHWTFAILAAAAAVSVPVIAQVANKGMDFVEAVRTEDGNKALQLLASNPQGIVDTKGADGNTGLILAIARSDPDWTGWLIAKGADPNLPGKGGETPLIIAARVGFEEAVALLLEEGAKVDATNRMGETALIVAVQGRQRAIVGALLAAGANPDKTDAAQGYSARDYAKRDTRSRDILKLIEAKKPAP